MGQMTIAAYTDENFSSEYKSALELPINPDKVKFTKGIQYAEDKQLGSLNGSNVYARYRPETLYFECLLDMTNALDDDREKKPVHDVVNDLEQRLYCYKALETEYTLFDLDGIPLRAELKVTLTGYCSQKEENKRFPKRSPDVSRMVTLKEGQTLAALCNEVYGDPLLVGEVARFNNLNGYRNVPSGTKILLPMLKK